MLIGRILRSLFIIYLYTSIYCYSFIVSWDRVLLLAIPVSLYHGVVHLYLSFLFRCIMESCPLACHFRFVVP